MTTETLGMQPSKTKPAAKTHTTPDEMNRLEVLFDENKAWQRTNSKDKTLHRVVHLSPNFHSVSGEDLVNVGDPETPVMAHACTYSAHVVRYSEKKGLDNKPVRTTLGEFMMDGLKFLDDFSVAD